MEISSLEELFLDFSSEYWEPGYLCPEAMVWEHIFVPEPPIIDTTLSDDHKTITLQLAERDDISRYSGSIASSILPLPKELVKLKNFIHDFTFGLWTRETDVKLSSRFPGLSYDKAKLTPDFLWEDGENILIVEFATCNSSHLPTLEASYSLKKAKYEEAIRGASELAPTKMVFFGIIVVGNRIAASNMNLSSGVLSELQLRFKIGKTIFAALRESGVVTDAIISKDPESLKLYEFLTKVSVDGPYMTGEFSFENYRRLVSPEDPDRARSLFEQAMGRASLDVNIEMDNRPATTQEVLGQVNEAWQKYEQAVQDTNPGGFTHHPKSIINVPATPAFYDPSPSFDIRNLAHSLILSDVFNDATYNCWVSCIGNYLVSNKVSEEPHPFIDPEGDDIQEEYVLGALSELNATMDERYSETGEKLTKKQRRSYNRVTATLTTTEWVQLATVGINGKTYAAHPDVSSYRREKKKPMALDINTEDLDAFIRSDLSDWFQEDHDDFFSPSNLSIQSLLNRADNLHPNRDFFNKYYNFYSSFARTKYYKWSKFISDIATEVAVSFKQHCGKEEFIIKKLRDWKALILIKPSRSGSHCFFSIMVQGDRRHENPNNHIFRKWESNGYVSWTDFISLNKSKISNWVQAESRSLTLFTFWTESHKCEPFACTTASLLDEDDQRVNKALFEESYKMVWLSTLISLCDKAEVEEACSLSRFIVMESFVNPPLVPKPEKMMEKFPERCRSRLTVWILHRLKELCYHCKKRPTRLMETNDPGLAGASSTDTTSQLSWTGFMNWFTGTETTDPGLVVNLMYIGYVKNKHEDCEGNAESKLLNKILTLEEKLTEQVKRRIGMVNKPFHSGTYHEWNIDGLKHCCSLVKRKLSREAGGNITNHLDAELETRLKNVAVEDVFMTLKASSNFDKDWFVYADYSARSREQRERLIQERRETVGIPTHKAFDGENFNHKQYYSRSKVITKSADYVGDNKTKVIDILPRCFEELESNGSMRICIFKKQQHGGLREIYVLNFAERVVQYVIELAGRVLCEQFPGETMTHPRAKRFLMEEHQKKVRQRCKNRPTYTTYTSADAAKWSQNQYSLKLASVLLQFYPVHWHGFLMRSMEKWRRKNIKLSDELLFLLDHNDGLRFWDDTTEKIYKAYRGLESQPWMKKGNSYVTTRSGMMQGILHYVSSAFHSVVNTAIVLMLERWVAQKPVGFFLVTTVVQSSDDSGLMVSICHSERAKFDEVLKMSALCHYFKCVYSEEMAIKNSVKTTFNCGRVFEFNSKFYFGDQLFEPDIKQAYAANMVSEQESLIERQEEAYTLLSGFISAGGSFYCAKMIQYSQAIFFYRTLGSTVSRHFNLLANALCMLPDPSLGFFLLDHSSCVGLTGFSFNHWNCVKQSKLGRFYARQLEVITNNRVARKEGKNVSDLVQTLPSGSVLRRVRMSWGSSKKLQRLKSQLSLDPLWVDFLDEHPDLMFRKADTTEEYKIKISLKLSQRGVSTSLSTGVPVTSLIASSLYCIQDRVFYLSEETGEEETKPSEYQGETKAKISLSELMACALRVSPKELTIDQERLMFPLLDEFSRMKAEMDSIQSYHYVRKFYHRRRVTTSVTVFESDGSGPVSIISLLGQYWFPHLKPAKEVQYPQHVIRPKMEELKETVQWLRDDPKSTLLESPFDHIHQMVNWFRCMEEKNRKVTFLGVPLVSKKGRTTQKSVMINNFHKAMKLTLSVDHSQLSHGRSTSHNKAVKKLMAALAYPWPAHSRERHIDRVLLDFKDSIPFKTTTPRSRINSLRIMCDAIDRAPVFDIVNMIYTNKLGMAGYWERPQIFDGQKYVGDGVWLGVIAGVRTRIEVCYSRDKRVTLINGIYTENVEATEQVDWAKGMRLWEIEQHVTSKFSPDHSNPKLVYKNGKVAIADSGVRVLRLQEASQMLIGFDEGTTLSVRYPSQKDIDEREVVYIKLMTSKQGGPERTVLNYPISYLDWNSEQVTSPVSKYRTLGEDTWLNVRELDLASARAFYDLKGPLTQTLVGKCLRGSFERRGVFYNKANPVVAINREMAEIPENPDLEDDGLVDMLDACLVSQIANYDQLMGDDMDDNAQPVGERDDEVVRYDNPDDEADMMWLDLQSSDDLTGEFHYERVTRPVKKSVLKAITESHPFLNAIVNDIFVRTSPNRVNEMIRTQLFYREESRVAMMVQKAFPETNLQEVHDSPHRASSDSHASLFGDLA